MGIERGFERSRELGRSADEIVAELQRHGILTLPVEELEALPRDSWQRNVVVHIKQQQRDIEEVGQACFGDEWQAGKWI